MLHREREGGEDWGDIFRREVRKTRGR